MRILTVIHTPWSTNLGAPRVQIELLDEFTKLGHTVEKFSYEDAFPHRQSQLEQLTCNFSLQAKAFVQKNAHRFDIIDASQTDLPFSKEELGFKGLLVARSAGLIPMYKEAFMAQKETWSEEVTLRSVASRLKSSVRSLVGYRSHKRRYEDVLPSLQACDLINVPNTDELAYIRDAMRLGDKCVYIPLGLSEHRQQAFEQAVQSAHLRLAKQKVAFIGVWSPRKGSKDWGEIIRRVRKQVPGVIFVFLGTGASKEAVYRDLKLPESDWIRIVPNFDTAELPKLLSQCMVGAFPSYIEGFGLAVLEKLACGLPTVAYDVPGPREMLRHLDPSWMVPAGGFEQFSNQVVRLLSLDEDKYHKCSRKCIEVAKTFSWSDIAAKTIEIYSENLERVQTP